MKKLVDEFEIKVEKPSTQIISDYEAFLIRFYLMSYVIKSFKI